MDKEMEEDDMAMFDDKDLNHSGLVEFACYLKLDVFCSFWCHL